MSNVLSRYRDQGAGPLVPGLGIELVELLEARDGALTLLRLTDERELRCVNVAAGRDMGALWEHMTLNISPDTAGEEIEWISTEDVEIAYDPATGAEMYRKPAAR